MITHELLVATRNEITKRGWCQRARQRPSGEVCIYGALAHARRNDIFDNVNFYDDALARALGFANYRFLVTWQDRPQTTKEHVLARLDEAIARTAPMPADPLPEPERALVEA